MVEPHGSSERRLGLIVHTSAVMNIYSGINGVVEITTLLRLGDAKVAFSFSHGYKSKSLFSSWLLPAPISLSFLD